MKPNTPIQNAALIGAIVATLGGVFGVATASLAVVDARYVLAMDFQQFEQSQTEFIIDSYEDKILRIDDEIAEIVGTPDLDLSPVALERLEKLRSRKQKYLRILNRLAREKSSDY